MEKESDQSKFIIQRFDTYISGANTKGSFLLAFNTFVVGGIIANYKNLKELIEKPCGIMLLNVLLISICVFALIATILIMKAVYPFLKSGNSINQKYHSHIFFGSVAEFKNDVKFLESYQKQTDAMVNEDLARQVYQLAKGVQHKYQQLTWAMIIVYIELFILFLILLLIIIN